MKTTSSTPFRIPALEAISQYRSVAVLVIANVIPILGVLFLGWDTQTLIWTYWLESAVIGIENAMKMVEISRRVGEGERTAHIWAGLVWSVSQKEQPYQSPLLLLPALLFFANHYGFFMFIHGVFLLLIFGLPKSIAGLAIPVASLSFSHGFSYWNNFLGGKEYVGKTMTSQMFAPYNRIGIVHLTIILSGSLVVVSGLPLAGIITMAVLKTAVDLSAHIAERKLVGVPQV